MHNESEPKVARAADSARGATAALPSYVVVAVTDSSLRNACDEVKRRSTDNPLLNVFVNGSRTRWMVVLGPAPTAADARVLKAQGKNIPPDSFITRLAPDWTSATCAE